MFDATTGLTDLELWIEHVRAFAGGLVMSAHRYSEAFLLPARSNNLGPASIVRCDHCREELGLGIHFYWHMQFCSSACMTAYQRRLAPETKVKISQLEASRESLAAA
jgi:hypothetical protein